MKTTEIKKVAVVGGGTMGIGIAQVIALTGYEVVLYDLFPQVIDKAVKAININLDKGIQLGKLTQENKSAVQKLIITSCNEEDLVADLVIEAVIEDLEVKQKVFSGLEKINSKETILASNTSSISITRIAAELEYPNRFLGIHFFNPAHIMKLVEVISGAATDSKTTSAAKNFVNSLGKVAVEAKDSPGFIVNRVARHFYVESLKILEENVAEVETIDKILESSGFRMGPFRLMDLIGVDTNFAVTNTMFKAFHSDPKFRPSRIQQQKVFAGHLGRKTGKGFYDYE